MYYFTVSSKNNIYFSGNKLVLSDILFTLKLSAVTSKFRTVAMFIIVYAGIPHRCVGMSITADPGGRAVWDVGLRSLICWDCGFEFRRGLGCLSVASVVCCYVEVSALGRSLVRRRTTECGVCSEWSRSPIRGGHDPESGRSATGISLIYVRTVFDHGIVPKAQ